jgi:hypothetical protein
MNALTLITTLHLLTLCPRAVHLALLRFPMPLAAGPGDAPRRYSDESLLLTAVMPQEHPCSKAYSF